MTMTDTPVDNGVNVQALFDARGALSQATAVVSAHIPEYSES
jgi:hypothetical protein